MYAGVVVVYLDLGVVGGISDIYNKSGSCSLIPNLLPGCLVTSQSDGFGVTRSYNMFYAHLDILKYPQICTNCVTIHFQIEILTACGLDRVLM